MVLKSYLPTAARYDGGGYNDIAPTITKHWTRKSDITIPDAIETLVAGYTSILDGFCVDSIKKLNLKDMPIEFSADSKKVTYVHASDMREIFIPLQMKIDVSKNNGLYELDFQIQRLTMQGIKIGLVANYDKLYGNAKKRAPYHLEGGYIGIFKEDNNVLCWDALTKHMILNQDEWQRTFDGDILIKPNDTVTMTVDTKHKLMHLALYRQHKKVSDICCVSFAKCINCNDQQSKSITPCVSLLFYRDCVEVSDIRHHILASHHIPQQCAMHMRTNRLYNLNVKERLILGSIVVAILSIYCIFLRG